MATARKYELYGDEFRGATYETFAQMRDNDPVLFQTGIDGETMLWFVTRHDDAVAVLSDDVRFTRDPARGLSPEQFAAFSAETPEALAFIDNLLQHTERRAELKRDPSLIGPALEELLRYDSAVERTLNRWATDDVELGGQKIKRGESVIVILGSADRDPARFADPDELDFARVDNRHIAFGRGSHYCLGAPLARLEGEIALATLLRRLLGLRLAVPVEDLSWRPVPLFPSLVELPVAW